MLIQKKLNPIILSDLDQEKQLRCNWNNPSSQILVKKETWDANNALANP